MAFKAGYDKLNGYKYDLAITHQGIEVEQIIHKVKVDY